MLLINALPTPTLGHTSPFHKLFNTLPDYSFLKVFGCAAFPFTRPYNSSKMEYRSQKCIFLGYSPLHKGYRCLSSDGKIYISKSVEFDESSFPYELLFNLKSSSAPHLPVSTIKLDHPIPPSSIPSDSSSPPLSQSPNMPHSHPSTPSFTPSHSQSTSSSPLQSVPHPVQPLLPPLATHPPLAPSHSMVTRSKNGILKHRALVATASSEEPASVSEALLSPAWKQAMQLEYDALISNHTWDLVLPLRI